MRFDLTPNALEALEAKDFVAEAVQALQVSYGREAKDEALRRARLAEENMDRNRARRWYAVHRALDVTTLKLDGASFSSA